MTHPKSMHLTTNVWDLDESTSRYEIKYLYYVLLVYNNLKKDLLSFRNLKMSLLYP